jgi:hypothetical protein
MKKIISLALLTLILSTLLAYSFGKNKVQSNKLEWNHIATLHFDIYFAKANNEFGKLAALMAEESYYYLKQDFKRPVKDRIPIIFYPAQQAFQTTNIISSLLSEGVGGFTESLHNRVVLPFNGSYKKMEKTLVHELTHAYVNELSGSSFSMLQTGSLPFWFSEGLPEFESVGGEDTYNNMFIIDLVLNQQLPNLNNIGGYYAYRLGEAFLTYLADEYDRNTMMELFYALRITRSTDAAFKKVFGVESEEIQKQWHNFLKREYFPLIEDYELPYEKYHKQTFHSEDGSTYNYAPIFVSGKQEFLYFSDKNLRNSIWKVSLLEPKKKQELIVKGEATGQFEEFHFQRNNLTWLPDGVHFAFVAKTSNGDKIYIYNLEKEEVAREIFLPEFDAIYEIDFSHDGKKIVFSGQKNMASDIYIYNLENDEIKQITNDKYADQQPVWSHDDSKIVFSSERNANLSTVRPHIFGTLSYDIYYYDLAKKKFYEVTHDAYDNTNPIWSKNSQNIIFISEKKYSSNFETINIENGKRGAITHTIGGVFTGSLDEEGKKLIFSAFHESGWDIYVADNPFANIEYKNYRQPQIVEFKNNLFQKFDATRYRYYGKKEREFKSIDQNFREIRNLDQLMKLDSLYEEHNRKIDEKPTKENVPEIEAYKTKFLLDSFWGGMSYSPSGGTYAYFQFALSDLMRNHAIGTVLGISGELDNSNFVFNYLYLAKRIDYGFGAFYLNNEYIYQINYQNSFNSDYYRKRFREYGIYSILRYPFNKFWRLDLENYVRHNEIRRDWWDEANGEWLEEELPAFLGLKTYNHYFSYTPQLSITHDNVLFGSTGPISGWRGTALFSKTFSEEKPSSIIFTDIRSYKFFAKRYALAGRIFGGGIFGETNTVFELDPFDGVRGYENDDLQGNRKAVASLELRYPFVDKLDISFPLPLQFRNIRGSVFVDAGAVWQNSNLDLYKDEQLNDLKLGFGFGPRFNMGYFVLKLDIAWNSNLNRTSKPTVYFSLLPDF